MPEPMFKRRHYEKIAEVFAIYKPGFQSDEQYHAYMITKLANMFQEDNPRFNRDKFYKATRGE